VTVRVFISYAHESAEHQEAVRLLWVLLRSCGVDAKLDLAAQATRVDWSAWMPQQIDESDFVLVMASPAYRRRAEPGAEPDDGRGVQSEAAYLREKLTADRRMWLPRILPVVLPGQSVEDIPGFLQPHSAARYRIGELTQAGIEPLLRVLLGRPLDPEPPLGVAPSLPPRPLTGLRQAVSVSVEIENGELVTRTDLAGSPLGEHRAPIPYGLGGVWGDLRLDPHAAQARLSEAGERLARAMFDEPTMGHLSHLVERAAFGTVVDLVITADATALAVPFELLRLPDQPPLVTRPTVRMSRRLRGIDRAPTRPLPGPLKILAAVAAPDETRTANVPLDVEAEMQAILDAVGAVDRRTGAEVTILEVASAEQIGAALRADQYHVLHLSAHGSPSTVELEDEEGTPVQVPASELVDQLKAADKPVPLIVLSSCSGAAAGLEGLAAALVQHGADRVVAMQTSVSDGYATRLAGLLYESLAGDTTTTVADALARARRDLETARLRAAQAGGRVAPPEYGVATLLSAGGDPPLWDASATPAPLARRTLAPSGRSVRELPIGYLIGRRPQLRKALAVLRGTSKALDEFGVAAGVALTGIGGIGKTALAGRIRGRLTEDGWLVAVHDGRWSPPALFDQTALAIAGVPGLDEAHRLLDSPETEDTVKLSVVCALLRQVPLLLVFDDFEQNLPVGGGEFLDPGFGPVFGALKDAAEVGRLLVTCRYPLPEDESLPLVQLELPPLSSGELGRMFLRLPQLRDLSGEDRRLITATIGGHPRLIEFVDALLRQGRASLRDITVKLRALARSEHLVLTGSRDLSTAVTEAVLLGSRDIVLTELVDLLTDEQRELLLQAAVSAVPLSLPDLAFARYANELTEARQRQVYADADRLLSLTLLSPAANNRVVVHAWVSDALRRYHGDALTLRRDRAVEMHLRRLRSGQWAFDDLTEPCRHLAANQRFDDLADLALAGADAGIGELAVTALLGPVVAAMPIDHRDYLPVADRELTALLRTGNTSAARDRMSTMLNVAKARAQTDPDNTRNQRNLSVSYNKLGDLMRDLGNTAEAQRLYTDSLAIRQQLATADPDNTRNQRNLSLSYERLGDLMRTLGNTAEAQRLYTDKLAIDQRLTTVDPDDTENQRNLSISYNKLGDLMRDLGNTAEAQRLYTDSLTIRQQLATADPDNTQNQRDLSISYERLGGLMHALGNTTEAQRLYTDSLTIGQRLATADPDNTQNQRDLGVSYNKLGDLMHDLGNTAEAQRLYTDSLTILQRLAEADPRNVQAQRDLSIAQERLDSLTRTPDKGEA
jgi:tetratricopeptide (TPR) repeat protein